MPPDCRERNDITGIARGAQRDDRTGQADLAARAKPADIREARA